MDLQDGTMVLGMLVIVFLCTIIRVHGLTSSQFPPAEILPSHYNNIPLYSGTNSICYTDF